MSYSTSRTQSAGTLFTYLPRPHSCSSTYETLAYQSPSGQRTQPSCVATTQRPSCSTSMARGSSNLRTLSDTPATVGRRVS